MFRFAPLLLVIIFGALDLIGQTVQVYQTTPDFTQAIQAQAPLTFTSTKLSGQTITIDDTKTFQQMDGFGASMTDASGWVLYTKLSTAQRGDVMAKLFDRTNGIALRFIRIPMGSSDESVTVYSYDDLCTPAIPTSYCTTPNGVDGKMLSDPTLSKFSIAHDEAYIIPLLQQARDLATANRERIKFMANPWSPPGWMKTTGSMLGTANGVAGTLKPEAYDPLAQYFVKFVRGYASHGLHIDYISPQNEPLYAPSDYSGLLMSSTEQANFLTNNLAPAFASANIDAKIMIWDHNWDNVTFPEAVLGNEAANRYAAGVAWHHYAGNPAAMSTVHDKFPNKDQWETEASMFANDTLAHVGIELINSTRNWAKSYVLWDLANDQNMGPHVGGCATCRPVVTVDYSDPNNVKFVLTTDYYALGQASKFILPGAYRIDSDEQTLNGIYDVAFRNPDGSIVAFVTNNLGSDQSFNIKFGDLYAPATIKANSIATFVWTPAKPAVVSLSHQPNGLTLVSGQAGSVDVTITPLAGTPNVTVTCSVLDVSGNVTPNFTCSAAQSSFSFSDTTPQTTTVTLTPTKATSRLIRKPGTHSSLPVWLGLAGLPFAGLVLLGGGRKQALSAIALIALLPTTFVLTSCGGGAAGTGSTPIPPPPSTQQVATPAFSTAAGSYATAQTVGITDTTPGATIYYTTDGTTPTAASTKYTAPLAVTHTQTIKALAVASGYTDSSVASATYTITGTSGNYSMVITAKPDTGSPVSITVPVTVQ